MQQQQQQQQQYILAFIIPLGPPTPTGNHARTIQTP